MSGQELMLHSRHHVRCAASLTCNYRTHRPDDIDTQCPCTKNGIQIMFMYAALQKPGSAQHLHQVLWPRHDEPTRLREQHHAFLTAWHAQGLIMRWPAHCCIVSHAVVCVRENENMLPAPACAQAFVLPVIHANRNIRSCTSLQAGLTHDTAGHPCNWWSRCAS